MSLVDQTQANPALPNGNPFEDVQLFTYWSATTDAILTSSAITVRFDGGGLGTADKGSGSTVVFVWCVRGGQGHDGF